MELTSNAWGIRGRSAGWRVSGTVPAQKCSLVLYAEEQVLVAVAGFDSVAAVMRLRGLIGSRCTWDQALAWVHDNLASLEPAAEADPWRQ